MLELKVKLLNSRGFTLIELLVTISIIAIAMAIAVPSMSAFMRNAELTRAANNLLASVNTARSEAMKRGMNAMLTPIDDTNWRKGWVVFVDVARDGDPTNATNIRVTSQSELPSYFDVSGFNVSFDASGYARSTGGNPANGSFVIKRNDLSGSEQVDQTRKVVVSITGRVRTCKPKTASATEPDCPG